MSTTEIIEIIKNAYSINDVCLKVYGYTNGSNTNKINTIISNNNVDVSHFKTKNKNRKWEKIEKICPVCKSTFHVNENSKKITCSVGCSNTYFRSNKSEEVKEKISQSLRKYISCNQENTDYIQNTKHRICNFCGKEFERKRLVNNTLSQSKLCSDDCAKKSASEKLSKSIRSRIENGQHKGWQSRKVISYPEKFFIEVLKNNNLGYEFNYPINKRHILGVDEPYNYFIDFYFPDEKIALEIDGSQHKYRKEHDILRDQRLSKVGIKVYRIKWKSINTDYGKEYISEQINNFLDFYNRARKENLSLETEEVRDITA